MTERTEMTNKTKKTENTEMTETTRKRGDMEVRGDIDDLHTGHVNLALMLARVELARPLAGSPLVFVYM